MVRQRRAALPAAPLLSQKILSPQLFRIVAPFVLALRVIGDIVTSPMPTLEQETVCKLAMFFAFAAQLHGCIR